jgi:hypothetical protein
VEGIMEADLEDYHEEATMAREAFGVGGMA